MPFCTHCGAEIAENDKICRSCSCRLQIKVIIRREKQFILGKNLPMEIYADGVLAASIGNGENAEFLLQSGEHIISIKWHSITLNKKINSYEDALFNIGMDKLMGGVYMDKAN